MATPIVPPELASILATLSQFAPAPPSTNSTPTNSLQPQSQLQSHERSSLGTGHDQEDQDEDDDYEPPSEPHQFQDFHQQYASQLQDHLIQPQSSAVHDGVQPTEQQQQPQLPPWPPTAFSQPQQQQQTQPQQQQTLDPRRRHLKPQQPQASPDTLTPLTIERTQDPRRRPAPQAAPAVAPQVQPQAQQKLIIDPATITEWAAGLRCVSKMGAQNPMFGETVKRMIIDQRKHEMQWYSGRQTLKQTQAKRSAGATQLQSILKSVGGLTPSTLTTPQSEDEKALELTAYDLKVYRAQRAMQDAMTLELKALGVPFFGTDADRILPPGVTEEEKDVENRGQQKWSPRITEEELLALQRRIVAYLEDMYKE